MEPEVCDFQHFLSNVNLSVLPQPDYTIKVVIIGDSLSFTHSFYLSFFLLAEVGKSSLLLRFTDGEFDDHQQATIGVDFRAKDIQFKNSLVRITLWDTAGQERFKTITQPYYRGAMGVILVYDVTRRSSFLSLERWLSEAYSYISSSDCVTMLVGNKADLTENVCYYIFCVYFIFLAKILERGRLRRGSGFCQAEGDAFCGGQCQRKLWS